MRRFIRDFAEAGGRIIASYTHLSPSDIVQAVKLLENNAQE